MTTDTFVKAATRTAKIDGVPVDHQRHLQGIGHDHARHGDHAGVRRDRRRAFRPIVLQRLLREGNDRSFNCITVDGDTSTSDTLLLFATAQGGP